MRLPRRTPAARSNELLDLYNKLFPDGVHAIALDRTYRERRDEGVRHCQVWLSRGACPHAVESTMALIEAQMLDEDIGHVHPWSVRTAYSMAILRFVNALADEMQTGVYAQSIFSIAEKINLPVWFVELRHAATHEELPSMDVLRRASVEALAWLQTNFWSPNITTSVMQTREGSPKSNGQTDQVDAQVTSIVEQAAHTLRTCLSAYRPLAKASARDGSQRKPNKAATTALQAKVVSCTRQADTALRRLRSAKGELMNASDVLASILVEPGHLIPLSRQKRLLLSTNGSIPKLSQELCDTWMPLLTYLVDSIGFSFYEALLEVLAECISKTGEDASLEKNRPSEDLHGIPETAAGWIFYLLCSDFHKGICRRAKESEEGLDESNGVSSSQELVMSTVQNCMSAPTPISMQLVRELCHQDPALQDKLGDVLNIANDTKVGDGETEQAMTEGIDIIEMEQSIAAMEQKLLDLQGDSCQSRSKPQARQATQPDLKPQHVESRQRQAEVCRAIEGWSLANQDWRPTPIGLLDGRLPRLELQSACSKM